MVRQARAVGRATDFETRPNRVSNVKERRQFGKAVAKFQGVQFMLVGVAMKIEAARQLTYAAAAGQYGPWPGSAARNLTLFSSACKCFASDVAPTRSSA
ncbi:MAG TPA: hypothetical protein DHU96_14275, partial [Actinobacteria bacterium]|nr:hypothetical protein [Actinomycetota bacterium]